MPKRLLTQLVRTLAGKPVANIEAEDFKSEFFPDLLKPTTLRLIVSQDFCDFGRDQFEKSMGILKPEDRKTKPYIDSEVPESCRNKTIGATTFWFELTNCKTPYGYSGPDGVALFHNPIGNIWRLVFHSPTGRLKSKAIIVNREWCAPAETEEGKGLLTVNTFICCMRESLFVLNEMPPVCVSRSDTEIRIPATLKTEHVNKEKPIFSTLYLRKEFTDIIGNAKPRETLDISGRRWHFVRGHWMKNPNGSGERVWRKFHWRGDAELGVVRKVYRGT